MQLSMSEDDLRGYVADQCNRLFPDGHSVSFRNYRHLFTDALMKTEECFKHVRLRGYSDGGQALFSHLHFDQYAQFIYILSHLLYTCGENESYSKKLMGLNRTLGGIFVSYKCELPQHFVFGHAIGTVLGNASYGDCLVVLQGVTINTGSDSGGERLTPHIGKGVFFAANSKVIGTAPIGDRVSLGVDACIYNTTVPDDSVVTRREGAIDITKREKATCHAQRYFDIELS